MDEDAPRASIPRWSSLALAYSVCASILFLFAPLGERVTASPSGQVTTHPSLVQSEGTGVILLLAVPVAAALAPVLMRRSRHVRGVTIASAVALTLMVIVGLWSLGLYYVPAAGLMIAAAAKERPEPRRNVLGFRAGATRGTEP